MKSTTNKQRVLRALDACRSFAASGNQDDEAALVALRGFEIQTAVTGEPMQESLVDLIADILHFKSQGAFFVRLHLGDEKFVRLFVEQLRNLADQQRLDWETIVGIAEMHFQAETVNSKIADEAKKGSHE